MQNQIERQFEQYTIDFLNELYDTSEDSNLIEDCFYIPEFYEL